MRPTKQGYTDYMNFLYKHSKTHPDEEFLSIQTFACHGIVDEGSQRALINHPNASNTYYLTIDVEIAIRKQAPEMPNVFFLVIFACCREGK